VTSGFALRALVAGSGFGCRIQVPALRGAGFDVVGLVGTDVSRTAERAAFNGVPYAFTDLDEAITRTGATVVAVGSSPGSHASLSMTAINRGCHVLCEKPMALDHAEAGRILAAAKRAGVVHAVGNEFRFVPARAGMARVIADGLIGEPRFANFTQISGYVAMYEADLPDWWFNPEAGGGWLSASGSHAIDQIHTCLGEFESVSGALPTVCVTRGPVEDSFVVRFRLSNGIEGILQQTASAYGPYTETLRVAGTKGTVWIEGISSSSEHSTLWIADRRASRELPLPTDLQLPPAPPVTDDPRQKTVEWQSTTPLELPPYAKLCQLFRDAIEGRAPAPGAVPLPTFVDGCATMRVIDAIRASAAAGGELVRLSRD
jgi:predicted dehydrogenase